MVNQSIFALHLSRKCRDINKWDFTYRTTRLDNIIPRDSKSGRMLRWIILVLREVTQGSIGGQLINMGISHMKILNSPHMII